MKEIRILIVEIKEGNKESFLEIVDRFSPLIRKYVKVLDRNDGEDVYAEMILALLEAVHSIRYYDNEGQVVNYICTALKNKFYELYRKSRYEHRYLSQVKEGTQYEQVHLDKNHNIVEYKCDIERLLRNYKNGRRTIYLLFLKYGDSDIKIAKEMGVSRQYIHKLRKELRREIEYIN